jgi:hypothetical protein
MQQLEGSYKAFRRVTFQQNRLKVISEKDDDGPKTYILKRPSHNELTSFFILRTLPLIVGRLVFVETFASDKSYTVEIQVLKRERVQTIFGEVEALKVKPTLPFKTVKDQKGKFYAWFTDDPRRIPVKLYCHLTNFPTIEPPTACKELFLEAWNFLIHLSGRGHRA